MSERPIRNIQSALVAAFFSFAISAFALSAMACSVDVSALTEVFQRPAYLTASKRSAIQTE